MAAYQPVCPTIITGRNRSTAIYRPAQNCYGRGAVAVALDKYLNSPPFSPALRSSAIVYSTYVYCAALGAFALASKRSVFSRTENAKWHSHECDVGTELNRTLLDPVLPGAKGDGVELGHAHRRTVQRHVTWLQTPQRTRSRSSEHTQVFPWECSLRDLTAGNLANFHSCDEINVAVS